MRQEVLRIVDMGWAVEGTIHLSNINFNLFKGEILGLCGLTNSGNKQVLKILAGRGTYNRGKYVILNEEVKLNNRLDAEDHGVFMLDAVTRLVENRSIAENVYILNTNTSTQSFVKWSYVNIKTQDMLELINLQLNPKILVSTLSRLERYCVELLKVIVSGAHTIILDSVIDRLSEPELQSLYAVIQILCEKGCSFILESKELDRLTKIVDRLVIIRDGYTALSIQKSDFDNTNILAVLTGGTHLIPLNIPNGMRQDDEVCTIKGQISDSGNPFSITVRKGEFVSLLDLDNSTCTHLGASLFGLHEYDWYHTSVELWGVPCKIKDPSEALRRKVAYIADDSIHLSFNNLNVSEYITLPNLDKIAHLKGIYVDHSLQRFLTEELLEEIAAVWVKPSKAAEPTTKMSAIPLDQRVLATLFRWKLFRPDVLIVDFPSFYKDVVIKDLFVSFVEQLLEEGTAILLITNDPKDSIQLSNTTHFFYRRDYYGPFAQSEKAYHEIISLL